MIISNDTTAVIERSGLKSTSSFTLQFNDKMAKILSDGLYSDKIKSVIRELCCNAIDSHTAAGKPNEPIHVHLPSYMEPWFSVTDYGTGLDHDQIILYYTRYGASNKTLSNDFIGKLGLGCKSPFSYVDAFDVTAIKNGVIRQYSMYKDESGMPMVSLLNESTTDKPNGVTVKMPVLTEDRYAFSNKAAQVFFFFETKPKISGISEIEYPNPVIEFQGKNWKIYARDWDNLSSYSHAIAVMGNVAYPIVAERLTKISDNQKNLLKTPLVIKFAIGELDVAASRESLSYDVRTQANIVSGLEQIANELLADWQTQISNSKTLWDAKIVYNLIMNNSKNSFFYKSFANNISFNFQNEKITSGTINFDWRRDIDVIRTDKNLKLISHSRKDMPLPISCGKGAQIIIDDCKTGGLSRAKNYIEKKQNSEKDYYLYIKPNNANASFVLNKLHGAPYVLTSQMEKATYTRNYKALTGSIFNYKCGQYSSIAYDLTAPAYYFDIKNFTCYRGEKEIKNIWNFVSLCIQHKVIPENAKIYAVRNKAKKIVQEESEWVDIWDHMTKWVSDNITQESLDCYEDAKIWEQLRSLDPTKKLHIKNLTIDDPNSVMAKYILTLNHYKHRSQLYYSAFHHAELKHLLDDYTPTVVLPKEVISLQKLVGKMYPMLSYIYCDDIKILQDYVNLVDRDQNRD